MSGACLCAESPTWSQSSDQAPITDAPRVSVRWRIALKGQTSAREGAVEEATPLAELAEEVEIRHVEI